MSRPSRHRRPSVAQMLPVYLATVAANPGATHDVIAAVLGVKLQTCIDYLNRLVAAGHVVKTQTARNGPGQPPVIYHVVPTPKENSMPRLKPITAQQIRNYNPPRGNLTSQDLADQYNEAWAGRTWQIVDGVIIYGSK